MKKNIKWFVTIALLMMIAVLVYYKVVNKDSKEKEEVATVEDKDKLLSKNLEENYPLTVCQVVQLFTRIQKCYYNEECSNEDIVRLAYMATELSG